METYKTIDELVELYKQVKAKYHRELNNLIRLKIRDRKTLLANTYLELVKYGDILERNGIDLEQFNKPYACKNRRKV